jgi:hypothetical protein
MLFGAWFSLLMLNRCMDEILCTDELRFAQLNKERRILTNREWMNNQLLNQQWTHDLSLNFTNGKKFTSKDYQMNYVKPMTLEDYRFEQHKEKSKENNQWIYSIDKTERETLQEKAEGILYDGFRCIGQQLYGRRFHKKDNMRRAIIFEYGKEKGKLHAHCIMDFSDWHRSEEDLQEGIKKGIKSCGGLASNEYDLQETYVKDGYSWSQYITKHLDYENLSNFDWRNSTIKKS